MCFFSKAKQSEAKKEPVTCSGCAKSVQEYNFKLQQCLKDGLLKDHPACAFAEILSSDPPTKYSASPFGNFPTGCVLSYQAIDYDKP